MKNIIPPMTHPWSAHWSQPNVNEIIIDDDRAYMNAEAFGRLKEYSATMPSGVYDGKMWKRHIVDKNTDTWTLCWFSPSLTDPNSCLINHREITIITPLRRIKRKEKMKKFSWYKVIKENHAVCQVLSRDAWDIELTVIKYTWWGQRKQYFIYPFYVPYSHEAGSLEGKCFANITPVGRARQIIKSEVATEEIKK